MSKTLQWTLGLCAVLITLAIVFSMVYPFFAPQSAQGGHDYGMMGPGHMWGGRHMLGGFGMPFFGFGMLLGPLFFFGLIALGIVWLVRATSRAGAPQPPAPTTNRDS